MALVRRLPFLLLILGIGGLSCEQEDGKPLKRTEKTVPLDRLAPAEQLPGRETVFGIEVPPGLRVSARFPDVVQLTGHVRPEAVANYFRKQVNVEHVELGAHRTVFPRVHVKNDPKKRLYRIDITNERGVTNVRMRDITQEPAVQGLSEKERWERAGRNPDGTLKDRLKVY